MLPRALFISETVGTDLLELSCVALAGIVMSFMARGRRSGQEKSRELDAFLARILDGLPIPVFEINKDHRVIQWNAALESLSGITKKEVIGTDNQWRAFYGAKRVVLADLIADNAPDSVIDIHYKNKAQKSQLIEGAYEAEDFFPSLGKGGRWYHFTASPIKEKGRIIGAIEILENVTERHIAEQNLKYYIGEVTRVQEEERKHIARELHDTTVQTLVALIYQVENFMAGKPCLTDREMARLAAVRDNLKSAVDEVRRFSRYLRTPILDDLGLVPALESVRTELKKGYGMDVTIEAPGGQQRVEPAIELALFRIIQEALNNAAKHSQASQAEVKLEFSDDRIRATVIDRGIGFDIPASIGSLPRDGKLGLAGIGERVELLGGTLKITSRKGQGTVMVVELPSK
jgi:two-component system sensor histidine kinase DegS